MSILFDETEINGMSVKNRFVRSATWEGMCTDEGRCTKDLVELTVDLARGGVGLIVMGHTYVQENGKATPRQTGIYRDDLIDSLRPIPDGVHEYGGKVAIQLSHCGGNTSQEWMPLPIVGPSSSTNRLGNKVRELTLEEIERIVEAFGQAARRSVEAGFDAIQIHSAHGYLNNQFLSPYWNKRKDDYGGPIENRARLLFEITQRVRKEVGKEFSLLVKINSEDFVEGGLTLSDTIWVCKRLPAIGIDAIEVSGGCREAGEKLMPIRKGINKADKEAYFSKQASSIKEAVSVPVIMVGGIRSFEIAERMVIDGKADFVSLSRPLIREPHLIERWRSGDRSRAKCLSDNKCLDALIEGKPLHCVVEKRKSG
ncbi:MAG: NADH:flavin oxidoreductase [Deltaproteobacteria bacterium]|nr:NADH:flavin oxidoreductase [Deltaproteobacteria bacterium]